jgi:hypothetical protein
MTKKKKHCLICGSLNSENHNHFCSKHNSQQFRSLIKYFGFNKNTLGTSLVFSEFTRIRNILFDLYWIKHYSSSEICKIFNYPSPANLTAKIFKYLEIPSKSCKECVKENIYYNRFRIPKNTKFKHGWHITWNNKKIYYRSSYELDFANQLDKKKIDYEVESLRIKYFDSQKKEFRISIPDFYIPNTKEIFEIKSSFTFDKQNMKDKFDRYLELGYTPKLILDYKEMVL